MAWLCFLQTLLCFPQGTVRKGNKHSNFHQKICVPSWMNMQTIICCFSISLSFKFFFLKIMEIEFAFVPVPRSKSFPKWYDHVIFVCRWVSCKYYKDTTQVSQTKQLTKFNFQSTVLHKFDKTKIHSNI